MIAYLTGLRKKIMYPHDFFLEIAIQGDLHLSRLVTPLQYNEKEKANIYEDINYRRGKRVNPDAHLYSRQQDRICLSEHQATGASDLSQYRLRRGPASVSGRSGRSSRQLPAVHTGGDQQFGLEP